jgi:hypothetical protein
VYPSSLKFATDLLPLSVLQASLEPLSNPSQPLQDTVERKSTITLKDAMGVDASAPPCAERYFDVAKMKGKKVCIGP